MVFLSGRARQQGAPSRDYGWAGTLTRADADVCVQEAIAALNKAGIDARYDGAGVFVSPNGHQYPIAGLARKLAHSPRWTWADVADAFAAELT